MTHERPTETVDRIAFYEAIEPEGMTALWSVMGDIITREPTSACVPFLWRYETVRTRLMEAADLITAKEAERRVLILENPGLRGQSKVTTSLFAGIQLVRSVAGGRTFEWTPRDVFVVPSWCPVHHEPCEDAVLFSYSDRPVQEKLGLWREPRGNEQGSPSP